LSSINKSVFGVEYQYKYILLKVLEYFLAGRLEYAFINFPINGSSQRSLDGKFVLMEPREIFLYEIKTGDNFKNDRKNELKHVLHVFYVYEQNNNEKKCKKVIVIDYKTKSRIENYILDLMCIKENRRNNNSGENITQIKKRVYQELKFDNSNISQNEFMDFFKEVDIEEGPSYRKNSENDILTDIEDKIKCVIDDFCHKLKIRSTDIEIPSFSIALELLEVIKQCSQNNKDIVEDICEKLTECLSRRRLIQEATYEKDKEVLFKDDIKPEIEKRISEITKIQIKKGVSSLWENKDNLILRE
jgi:hypothetical protein